MKSIKIFFLLVTINILVMMTPVEAENTNKAIKEKKLKPVRIHEKKPDENKLVLIKLSDDLKTVMEDQKYIGKDIIIKFNSTDVKKIIAYFSKVLGYKIIADPELNQLISFRSVNMPWNIALAKFLFENSLEMIFEEDHAIIRKKTTSNFYSNYFIPFLVILFIPFFFYIRKKIKTKSKRLEKSDLNLDEIFLDEYAKKILFLFEVDKIYTDENLSIQSLSEQLSIQPYILSKIINKKMETSFPSLLNNYRIAEAKRKLEDLGSTNLTILDIAFDVGFNTKTAFNRTFKKLTGLTPSQYKQNLK